MRALLMVLFVTFMVSPTWATPPAFPAFSTAEPPYKTGTPLYVWAISGVNLREQPADTAAMVKKLPYGTPVTVLAQDNPPVSYALAFFAYKNTADSATQTAEPRPQVVLNTHWLKVQAAQQQGYVLNNTLLPFVPMHPNEDFEKYLIRAFNLTEHQRQKKSQKSDCGEGERATKYTTVYDTFTSPKNKVVLKTRESGGDSCTTGHGGEIALPDLSFEQAFVFFNATLPPEVDVGFTYHANKRFEYGLDQAGASEATLKKTKTGVHFEWYFGMN